MSVYIDHRKNSNDLPVTYSINIKTLSTSKRPLTYCITTAPRSSTQRTGNDIKPSICPEDTHDFRLKSVENNQRPSIHLPVTYSTSIHLPCHPPTVAPRSSTILPTQSSHHHYHYHHHRCCHHQRQRQLSRSSTSIKHKSSPLPTSIVSTRPDTTSTTTTSPNLSSKPNRISIHPSLSVSRTDPINQPSVRQVPLPSYSALVWNWFQSIPRKRQSSHKGSQSDYSEVCRPHYPSKRSVLLKFLTSPLEKHSKSKQQRTCFTRKRFQSSSSSSLPNKFSHYDE